MKHKPYPKCKYCNGNTIPIMDNDRKSAFGGFKCRDCGRWRDL